MHSGPRLAACALALLAAPVSASDFYVSPTGSPANAGTKPSPWDLATALAQPLAVHPGDTIWLREGVYFGPFVSNLTGTPGLPIVVRQYPGELATIDGVASPGTNTLVVNGSDTWYWGFEVRNSDPTRVYSTAGDPSARRGEGIYVLGSRTKFINLVVHDTQDGIGLWNPAQDTEVYGSIVYNNGHVDPVRGEGHGLYLQNQTGTKNVRDVVSFNNFATGMKAYGETGFAIGVSFDGVVSFNNGSPAAFAGSPAGYDASHREANLFVGTAVNPADRISVTHSMLYHPTPTLSEFGNLMFGYVASGNGSVVATDNVVAGSHQAVEVRLWQTVTFARNLVFAAPPPTPTANEGLAIASRSFPATWSWDANSYFDATGGAPSSSHPFLLDASGNLTFAAWRTASGFDATSTYSTGRPAGLQVTVRPNAYEPGRAHVVVYNWGAATAAVVDLSAILVPGDLFEVRNAQNVLAAPVVSGTYAGTSVTLPLAGLSTAAPIGRPAPAPTGPEFNAFVVLKTASPATSPSARYVALTPCRLADTRKPGGLTSGQPIGAGGRLAFPTASACGVPAGARALALNATVVQPGAAGSLTLSPGGYTQPAPGPLAFKAGITRAVFVAAQLGPEGQLAVRNDSPTPTHVVLDVTGYFK